MVRVVSQNFSPPRSRHSSGETDRDLAERALVALSTLGKKRVEIPEYESSSDSFWDSEFDGDQYETLMSENGSTSNDVNGNEKSDVHSKRKERRRERNKLSAQAYRQRRRTQNVKELQTLMELEAENKRLHRMVETLEKKKEHTKHLLRGRSLPVSEILQPIGELEGASAEVSDTEADFNASRAAGLVHSRLYTPHPGPVSCLPLHSHPNPTLPPPHSHTNLTLPPPNFNNNSVCAPITKEPQQITPLLETNKPLNLTYPPPSNNTAPTLCHAQMPNHLFINTNVFIGATLSPSGVANLTTVPAFLTVPIENQKPSYLSQNLNCNLTRTGHPNTLSTTNPPQTSENETTHSKSVVEPSSVLNTVWWNGNQLKPNMTPVAGTIVGLVSMEMFNNNSMNNFNDANGNNNSCEKSVPMQGHPGSHPVSFNINLNHPTGTTCQEQFQIQNPVVSVQCFLASDDQLSVQ